MVDDPKLSAQKLVAEAKPASPHRPELWGSPEAQPEFRMVELTSSYRWAAPAISLVVLFGFFAILYALLSHGSDSVEKMGDFKYVVFTLLGILGAAFTQVLSYWLGSSKGSSDKTGLLVSRY
jgi:hypothetical protein